MIIETEKLSINPNAKIELLSIGPNQLPVLQVDDFYIDPEYIRELALSLYFSPYRYHPGDVAGIDLDPNPLIEFVHSHFPNLYDLSLEQFKATLNTVWHFALVRKTRDDLSDSHCRPHVDPLCLSGIIYLNLPEDCQGGTGFYMHKETQVSEIISTNVTNKDVCGLPHVLKKLDELKVFARYHALKDKYNWKVYNNMADTVLATPKRKQDHIRESNEDWELVNKTEMRFNRMIIFPSYLLHSLYTKDEWFGDKDEHKRLTQNLFFFWPKENQMPDANNQFTKFQAIAKYY